MRSVNTFSIRSIRSLSPYKKQWDSNGIQSDLEEHPERSGSQITGFESEFLITWNWEIFWVRPGDFDGQNSEVKSSCFNTLDKIEKAILKGAIKIEKVLSKLHHTASCTFTASTSLSLAVHRWAKHPEYFLYLFSYRQVALLSTLALHDRRGKNNIPGVYFLVDFLNQDTHTWVQ